MDLNGIWLLSGKDSNGNDISINATVPGCVHTDMQNNGLIGDMFYRDNSKLVQWIENNDYTYSRSFVVEDLQSNAYLEFDGLDTYCDVYLNNEFVAHCENMHIPYAFNVDGKLRLGKNLLEVKFFSPIKAVEGMPDHRGAFTTERMNTRRIQCTYSWDWVDRFVTMGIFRDVRLTFRKENEIDNFYICTKDINPYSAQIKIDISIRDFVSTYDKIYLEIISPQGNTVYKKSRAIVKNAFTEYVDITSPQLWYPNGYGEQPLYTLRLSTPTSEKIFKFGIRKITVLQIVDEKGSENYDIAMKLKSEPHLCEKDKNDDPSGFTALVNDTPIMVKGGNWVPCEPFPSGESNEKITSILSLSAAGGVNMVRIWGGGIFEKDHFYEECDRLGILVSQDFLMACGAYPEDEPWFIEALKKESYFAALRLRNYTCLAWWSGDNENAVNGDEDTDKYNGFASATYGIEPVLSELDPNRYFFASSPYGGKPYSSFAKGTTHNTYFLWPTLQYIRNTDMVDYRKYLSTYLARFNAEQAAIGMPFVSSLKKFLTDDDIFGEDDSMSEYHTKNNPALKPSLYEYVVMMSQKIFGDFTDGYDRVRKMQYLHCEWVRLSLELARRYKWYSSGIIYWMLNDCWPAANGWSLIDYYSMPKPAYYVFKRCASPILSSIEESERAIKVVISNDSLQSFCGKGRIYLYDFINDRNVITKDFSFEIEKNSSKSAFESVYSDFEASFTDSTIILCDIEMSDGKKETSFFIPERYKDLRLTYQDVKITEETDEYIVVTTDHFTPFAIIDVPYLLQENCFVLKKNEVRKIYKIKGEN